MKKIISFLLALLMLVSVIPMAASALSYKEGEYFQYKWVAEKGGWEVDGVRDFAQSSIGSGIYKIPDFHEGYPIIGIGERAFEESGINRLILSNNTQYIESYAFLRCKSLRVVYMPKTLTYIATDAFSACTALHSVYYQGTRAEWRALISSFSTTSSLYNASLHCEYPDYCYHISATRYEKIEPTCMKTGRQEGSICNDCGDILGGLQEIPKLAHKPYKIVTAKSPTCTESGYYEKICTLDEDCTYSEYAGESTPLGHNFARRDPACRRGCGFVCKCLCHKENFWWKIAQFFYRLFKIKEYCECGYYRSHWDA